jgi:hypothetical protein
LHKLELANAANFKQNLETQQLDPVGIKTPTPKSTSAAPWETDGEHATFVKCKQACLASLDCP